MRVLTVNEFLHLYRDQANHDNIKIRVKNDQGEFHFIDDVQDVKYSSANKQLSFYHDFTNDHYSFNQVENDTEIRSLLLDDGRYGDVTVTIWLEGTTLDEVFKKIPKGKYDQHYKGQPK